MIFTYTKLKKVLFIIIFLLIIIGLGLFLNKKRVHDSSLAGSFTIEDQNINPGFSSMLPAELVISINNAVEMRFGNTEAERDFSSWEKYSTTKKWNLSTGPGTKIVYAEFRNADGLTYKINASISSNQSDSYLLNNFNISAERWWIYNYNGDLPGYNIYYPASWKQDGGIDNSGFIWADGSRWKIDTPEEPDSILALVTYQSWSGSPPLNLRDAEISFYLRGEQLDLKGGSVYFWIFDNESGSRWHYTAYPLPITNDSWGEKIQLKIIPDETLWFKSWQRSSAPADSFINLLPHIDSYGLSFVGFPPGDEVIGKLMMDQFEIKLNSN